MRWIEEALRPTTVRVYPYASNQTSLERAAIAQAEAFFPPGSELEVVPGYEAIDNRAYTKDGERWSTSRGMLVRRVSPARLFFREWLHKEL